MAKNTKSQKPARSRKGKGRKSGKAKAPPKVETLPELTETEEPERKRPGAPFGNQFWLARSSHGRSPIFKNPEQLWKACQEYFAWVEAHPLFEMKPFAYQGIVVQEPVAKMRAMTIGGLCIFLDIARRTWDEYRGRDDFLPVVTQVEEVIRDQKFSGAAADLLNANIIARDLGLKDSQEHSGPKGGPIPVATIDMSDKDAALQYREFIGAV